MTHIIPRKLPPLPPISDLIRIYGLTAQQKFSQNFILDKNVTDTIAKHARVSLQDDLIVEVGPGPGLLTRSILDAGARRVVVIEKDPRFIPTLEQLKEASGNRLSIIMGDMLKLDHQDIFKAAAEIPQYSLSSYIEEQPGSELSQDVGGSSPNMEEYIQRIENSIDKPFDPSTSTTRILGNLPFGVASPLLIQWLKMMSLRQGLFQTLGNNNQHSNNNDILSMTLMFQREVADGIVAAPPSPDRSRLSVMAQSLCNVKVAYRLASSVFVPKPRVAAAVVQFDALKEPLLQGSIERLEDVARYYFNKRRKTMGHLNSRLAKQAPEVKPILDEWVAETRLDTELRSDQISTADYTLLAKKLDREQIKIPWT